MASYFVSTSGNDGNTGLSQVQAWLTIAHAFATVASGDTVNIQTGTYTQTATLSITVASLTVSGYQTTPGDNGTAPLITTATASTTLINTSNSSGGVWIFDNLSLSNTSSGTRLSGLWQLSPHGTGQTWVIRGCTFDGFATGIDCSDGTPDDVAWIQVINTEVKNCTNIGLATGGTTLTFLKVLGCYFHGNATHMTGGVSVGPIWLEKSIFAGSTATIGLNLNGLTTVIDQCTFANNLNTSGTLSFSGSNGFISVTNCIIYGNSATGGHGIEGGSTNAGAAAVAASGHNAYGGNTTNQGTPWAPSPGDVTLTANPFTNSSGGDYSLNSAAGGGALCVGAGFPGLFPGGTSHGHVDIGAVQSGGSTGTLLNSGFIY